MAGNAMVKVFPNVPKNDAMFRNPAANISKNWGFIQNVNKEPIGRILVADVDYGHKCSLGCLFCFKVLNPMDEGPMKTLTSEELTHYLLQLKRYGLQTIRICGAGEPFENRGFWEFLQAMNAAGIGVAIFTKGHVIGDDRMTRHYFGYLGFEKARDLCMELAKLNVDINLSFQSFYPEVQDALVGNIRGHTERRNSALEYLVEAGFNNTSPTRLALCANPIMRENYDELLEIYIFARERNILPVNAAFMTSGSHVDAAFLAKHDVSYEEKVALWVQIYEYNISHGLQTLEQVREEGISVMPGTHGCSQIARGFYLGENGNITLCAGCNHVIANIREGVDAVCRKVAEYWEKIASFKGKDNCGCPAKDGSLGQLATVPAQLYRDVMARLEAMFGGVAG